MGNTNNSNKPAEQTPGTPNPNLEAAAKAALESAGAELEAVKSALDEKEQALAKANASLAAAEEALTEATKAKLGVEEKYEALAKEKDAADETIAKLMAQLAKNVNRKSGDETKPAKEEKPVIPADVITALDKKWKAQKPLFNYDGNTYKTADVVASMPDLIAKVVAIEGQTIFKEIVD